MASGNDDSEGGSESLAGRISGLRRRLNRRRKSKRADKRAKARRIRRNEPQGVTEGAQAALKETKKLAKDLGISPKAAASLKEKAEAVQKNNNELVGLDVDNDGATDLLGVADKTGDVSPLVPEPGKADRRGSNTRSRNVEQPRMAAPPPHIQVDIERAEIALDETSRRASGTSPADPAGTDSELDGELLGSVTDPIDADMGL